MPKLKRGSARLGARRRPSTGRALKVAPSLPDTPTRQSTTPPYYTAHQSVFETDEISCACDEDGDEDVKKYWFECSRCDRQQHADCATPNTGVLESITDPLCNACKVAELHRYFTSQREQFEQLAELLREKRAEACELCAKVLWKHYCNLPDGHLSAEALEITRTAYQDGAMVPTHPAPRSWVEEVQNRIAKMVGDAGEDVVETIVYGPTRSGDLITDTSHLAYWRELAMWLLYSGPYRGNKAELGLLAEVLGLEERGTFWQEGWTGIQADLVTRDSSSESTFADDEASSEA